MKRCPACDRTYTDDELSFCINDGTVLVRAGTSDYPQATIMSPPPSVTEPPPQSFNDAGQSGWNTPPSYSPPQAWNSPGAWQQPPPPPPMQSMPPPPGMAQFGKPPQPQMSLAIASLVCGILSITLGLLTCTGPGLALIALVLGIVALVQIKNDPRRYGGKGFAFGGIALAALWGLILVFWIILMILGSIAH